MTHALPGARRRAKLGRDLRGGPARARLAGVGSPGGGRPGPTAKPRSAASMASARQASSPSRPWRAESAAQPCHGAGHRDRARAALRPARARRPPTGAGPAASRPLSSPSSQTSANASPPTPVDIGSVTDSTAAAASAASAALPPRSSARSPARVASGWLRGDHRLGRDRGRPAERVPEAHARRVRAGRLSDRC